MCRKWYDSSDISEETFKRKINNGNTHNDSFFTGLIEFLKNNLLWELILLTLMIMIVVIIVVRNKRKVKVEI